MSVDNPIVRNFILFFFLKGLKYLIFKQYFNSIPKVYFELKARYQRLPFPSISVVWPFTVNTSSRVFAPFYIDASAVKCSPNAFVACNNRWWTVTYHR